MNQVAKFFNVFFVSVISQAFWVALAWTGTGSLHLSRHCFQATASGVISLSAHQVKPLPGQGRGVLTLNEKEFWSRSDKCR